jgi:hypoxanthine phosphoribosyltransferase
MTNVKKYIDAQELMEDSIRLGIKILKSSFRPNFIVGVWRGGSPVGIVVQELLDFYDVETDHIAIRTSSYKAIGERESAVRVHGLSYLIKNINAEDTLLIVDDVHDTGLSIEAIIDNLQMKARKNMPEIRVATVYYKPSNNKTDRVPDYFLYETDRWLVFPHELDGLTLEEIFDNKPGLKEILGEAKLDTGK